MNRRNAFGLAFLVGAAGLGCVSTPQARIDELVRTAEWREDHQELVEYYRGQAVDARQKGAEHRRLAGVYGGRPNWGVAFANRAGGHCRDLAALEEQLAAHYELLASEHQRLAGE